MKSFEYIVDCLHKNLLSYPLMLGDPCAEIKMNEPEWLTLTLKQSTFSVKYNQPLTGLAT